MPPQLLQRRRLAASGTVRVSGRASTLTSAERPQFAQAAMTERTPFKRMLARVIGGPRLERMVEVRAMFIIAVLLVVGGPGHGAVRLLDAPLDLFVVEGAVEALLESADPRIFAVGPDVVPSLGRH